MPSHAFEDHTSEVRLRVEAATMAELFEEAARALAELMAEELCGEAAPPERVVVGAADREALLVAWLNELVFRSETSKTIACDVRVDAIDDREVRATIRGREPRTMRTAVKAATFHGVRVAEQANGFVGEVVLDV